MSKGRMEMFVWRVMLAEHPKEKNGEYNLMKIWKTKFDCMHMHPRHVENGCVKKVDC